MKISFPWHIEKKEGLASSLMNVSNHANKKNEEDRKEILSGKVRGEW